MGTKEVDSKRKTGSGDNRPELYRALFTAAILLTYVAVVVLAICVSRTAPQFDAEGNVLVDPFANAKDLLAGVAAVATLALGYWFGAAGRASAEERADQSQGAFASFVGGIASDETDRIKTLHQEFPRAFGLR